MITRFVKLSTDITKSTIWAEDHATFRLWIYLLATANREGIVLGTVPGIAIAARLTLQECEVAMDKFLSPDKYSANPANEGRRIQPVEGGWLLLNYEAHRNRRGGDPEWQAQRHAKNQKAYRERKKNECDRVDGNEMVTVTTEAEADTDLNKSSGSASSSNKAKSSGSTDSCSTALSDAPEKPPVDPVESIYQAYPRHIGKGAARKAIEKALDRLAGGSESKQLRFEDRRHAERWLWTKARAYAESPAGQRGNLTPHPSTWFNQSRYLDDPAEWQRTEANEEKVHVHTKRSVADDNIREAQELIGEIRARRNGDHALDGAGQLLRAPISKAGSDDVPRNTGESERRAVNHGAGAGTAGRAEVLPATGTTAAVGGRRNAGPVF